jgi:histidinol phosphatase-like enzyme (inositol monophosphatase family)
VDYIGGMTTFPAAVSRSELLARRDLALAIAREAGRLTVGYFQRADVLPERKSDNSPVTIADREAELLLRRRIEAAFPDDAIVGEEFPRREGRSGYTWILDPIDGTKSFIGGVPLYGTMVGVTHGERSLIGVVEIPALDERVYAAVGEGAWHQRGSATATPAHVSPCPRLADGILVTSEVKTFSTRGAAAAFEQMQGAAWVTRTWGDCYGYVLVATGRAAVMIDPILNVWDAAAIQPILEEAGGRFTDWLGRDTIHAGEAIGSNGMVHDEVLAITRAFAASK